MSINLQTTVSPTILLIDSYEIFLNATLEILSSFYPDAQIYTATTVEKALHQIAIVKPDLVITDIYVARDIGETIKINSGIQLIKELLKKCPDSNILVQSTFINSLVRIKAEIDRHPSGFVVADKCLSIQETLNRVKWTLHGWTHTKDIKAINAGLELKPEWLRLLNLAFEEGLQDKAIAAHICVSERMVRHYWFKLQEVLNINVDELKHQGKNLRVITHIRAREEGLID
ncbi:MAG: response regulator transcription factor [Rivularia sp. (in: Bacteria)]|nr:response regulator transcription factor [Rivularia sp. MS3]